MSDLAIESAHKDGQLVLKLSGVISGSAEFPVVDVEKIREVVIELAGVTYINSSGIRRWILWIWNMEKARPDLPIVFREVPSMFLKQMTNIRALVPRLVRIETFYVAFVCDCCGAAHEVLAKKGTGPIDGQLTRKCQKCGETMEAEDADRFPEVTGPFDLTKLER